MSERAPELHVAVCQLTSNDSVDSNLREMERLLNSLDSSATALLDLICFPENALYLRVLEGEPIVGMTLDDEAITRLSDWVTKHRTAVHIGSVPLLEEGKLYNSSLLLTSDGDIRVTYRKVHLFDVDVEGHRPVRESDVFAHGSDTSIFEIKGWKFGGSICYDIRFAELFLRYGREGVDAILIPAAFLVPTGKAHWDVLLRARAIESQAYVLAAAQGGQHRGVKGGTRETFGHSMIVDPWGQVIAACDDGETGSKVLRATLRAERLEAVRRQIPMKNHRRLS